MVGKVAVLLSKEAWVILIRDVIAPDFTLGTLTIGNVMYQTCEDTVRDVKIPGQTAIPEGKYKVVITFSNRFQKFLPLLLDVPKFTGVRIHSGNVAETKIFVKRVPINDKIPQYFEVIA